MPRFSRHLLLLLGLALHAAPRALAAAAADSGQQPAPHSAEPGSELTISLVTMGPGRRVWERFGHNAIWVHDPIRGTDRQFNYGLFDFKQQNFLLRFIQGRMLYWMKGFDAGRYMQQYVLDDRSVWVQQLNLTPAERRRLRDFLEWNERPENRFYHYDYFRDNCSTRIRDAIDRVLDGRIRAQMDTAPAGGLTAVRNHSSRPSRPTT
jgi:hypothetical protein